VRPFVPVWVTGQTMASTCSIDGYSLGRL
jgi:hypothetical protein